MKKTRCWEIPPDTKTGLANFPNWLIYFFFLLPQIVESTLSLCFSRQYDRNTYIKHRIWSLDEKNCALEKDFQNRLSQFW